VVEEAEHTSGHGGGASGKGLGSTVPPAVVPPLASRSTSVEASAARITSSSYLEVDEEGGSGPAGPLAPKGLNTILHSLGTLSNTTVSFASQARTQLWRRVLQAKRDRRGLFLQAGFPLVFVCISFVFRNMNTIDSATSLNTFAMSASQLTAPGVPHLGVPYLVNASGPAWYANVSTLMASSFAVAGSNGSGLVPSPITGVSTWQGTCTTGRTQRARLCSTTRPRPPPTSPSRSW
jgi:hypothetical protein